MMTNYSHQTQTDRQQRRQTLAQVLLSPSPKNVTDSIISMAVAERVEMFLLHQVREKGIDLTKLPNTDALNLQQKNSVAFYMLQKHALLTVNRALHQAGIKATWIKGAALAHTIYPQASLRMMGDLDVLVPKADIDKAYQCILDVGFQKWEKKLNLPSERLSHHLNLQHEKFSGIMVELHHRLLGHSGADYLSAEILTEWQSVTHRFELGGQQLHTFTPEVHFLYLCAHAFLQHGEAYLTLRELLDLHLIIETYDLKWDRILEYSERLNWTYLLQRAIEHLSHTFPTDISPDIAQRIHRLEAREDNTIKTVATLKSSDDIRGEGFLRILSKMTLRERIQTVFVVLFPPTDYMRRRYHISANESVYPYYLQRWGSQVSGLAKTIINRVKLKKEG